MRELEQENREPKRAKEILKPAASFFGGGARPPTQDVVRFINRKREAVHLLSERPELVDPRIATLADYDRRFDADLLMTLDTYIDAGCNAREAARLLDVHPNTLRYRVSRAQELTGFDLARSEDRLLVALQLAMRGRLTSSVRARGAAVMETPL